MVGMIGELMYGDGSCNCSSWGAGEEVDEVE